VTDYQRGYQAAVDGSRFQQGESEEWIRGFHDGVMDLAAVKAKEASGD